MKLQAGTIGAGGYAGCYLDNFSRLAEAGKIDLRAIVIIRPGEVADASRKLEKYGTEICASTAEMYAKFPHLDIIGVPTSIASHEPLTLEALAHGCNVLVEKPASGSVESVRRMIRARDLAGKTVTVGFQHVHSAVIQDIKRKILSGEYGKVRRIAVLGLWPRSDAYYSRNSWAGRLVAPDGTRILDSPLNNAFAHYLNFPLFLCGKTFAESAVPLDVEGVTMRARKTIESFDSCALKFRVSSGAEILYLVSHTVRENLNPEIRIECENAVVHWNSCRWSADFRSGKSVCGNVLPNPVNEMFDSVADMLAGGNAFACTLEAAMNHARAVEMVWKKIPITDIPREQTVRLPDGTIEVTGMAEQFRRSFNSFSLPHSCEMQGVLQAV